MLKRVYSRLSAQEMTIAREFLARHAEASPGDFERAVNRMFMDKPKPKHFVAIMELLTSCVHP